MFSIGIRYCGGCNPQIDRSRIIRNLKNGLKKIGLSVNFNADKKRDVDILLLINGCMHACLEEEYRREGNNPPFISVKGEMVNDHYIEEKSIPEFLINKIMDLLNSSSK